MNAPLERRSFKLAIGLAAMLASGPALSVDTSLQYVLTLGADAERKVVSYRCEDQAEPLQVEYLNAAPNYLAIMTLDDSRLIFASVLSGSGVRYAAGHYEWQTKGPDASLHDLLAGSPDAPPILTCLEANDIP